MVRTAKLRELAEALRVIRPLELSSGTSYMVDTKKANLIVYPTGDVVARIKYGSDSVSFNVDLLTSWNIGVDTLEQRATDTASKKHFL